MKQVNFVYTRNKLDFKKYVKSIDYTTVISYHDIITKLIKNDKSNEKPSEFVINSYLRYKILKTLNSPSKNKIIYAINDLDYNVISSVKNMMVENSIEEIEFNLVIVKHKKLEWTEDDDELLDKLTFINDIKYTIV